MSQKTYLLILKIGAYISFICFFFVFKNLLFPYITSKQIPFNILIEVLFIFWLTFIIKYPHWNPFKRKNKKTKNLITLGLTLFFAVLTITCFTGADFNLSFWGDIERMLGVFHLLHFLVLYFIIITVMRDWKDWKIFFIISIIACFFISLHGLNTPRHHSTIGNTAYISGLIIFNIYFAFILFFKETKYKYWRYLYLIPLFVIIEEFTRCRTSGAYVGLGFSVICFFLLYGFTLFIRGKKEGEEKKEKKQKKKATIFLIIFIIIAGSTLFFFTNKDNKVASQIIEKNKGLREISIKKNTFQTRLISWKAAMLDFKEHWLLGVGHGNYALIFDKHFDASFYNYSRGETYFDRAHNNLIDIASTAGIFGLLTHLFIFVAVGIYLFKAFFRERLNPMEFSLISALFIAYFVQNLAVFDSFITYFSLMMLLGYVHFIANTDEEEENKILLLREGDKDLNNEETTTLIVSGIIIIVIMYQFNILPLKMLDQVIKGQILFGQNKLKEAIAMYDKALSHETVLDRDGRDILIRSLINRSSQLPSLGEQEAEEAINFGIDTMERNLKYSPTDSLMNMQMARMYDVGFRIIKDKEKKKHYAEKSLEAIEKSLEASPERIPVHFIKSQFLVNQGRISEALEILEYTKTLNADYFESDCQLAQVYFIDKQDEKAYTAMDNCLDHNGTNYIGMKAAVEKSINHYAEKGDFKKLIMLYQHLARFDKKNPKIWINLAKLYAQAGKKDEAVNSAKQAAKLDKNLQKDVDEFIKSLETIK